jgi:cell division septum initiation protein DivIVA
VSGETLPPPDEVGTVVDIINTLEEVLAGARRLPFTPNVVVNEEEILELVDRIRVALPDDLRTARHTLDERDQMLERARHDADELSARATEEAERMVREAQAHAASLVEEHAIVLAATEQANQVVASAEEQAASQRSGADDYAREVMERLEGQLDRWLATVREGIGALPADPQARRRRKR